MLPWVHLYSNSNGSAMPCCDTAGVHVGNTHEDDLADIWNSAEMREIRLRMLNDQLVEGCRKCYEKESVGLASYRKDNIRHFAHHINEVDKTAADGSLPTMRIRYWDVRFSNVCNLRCRTCGPRYSSNWYEDAAKLVGDNGPIPEDWKTSSKKINYAGRHDDDIWHQLIFQIDNVERIYFAGGEPLIMEDHYRILKELIKRGKTDVALVYNTNFSQLQHKKDDVLELWKQFSNVSVGASLDAMGARAEYIRKGTDWTQVERNRERMMQECPHVNFYISPTISIMNVLHLPDFHRAWVEKGFIKPADIKVGLVQNPVAMRIDVLPSHAKDVVAAKYLEHISWVGNNKIESDLRNVLKYMFADDKSYLLPDFRYLMTKLDGIRNEDLLTAIPELSDLMGGENGIQL
jgi:MoaA/NifB/PqqE/SkfB family radical SAM enzyme